MGQKIENIDTRYAKWVKGVHGYVSRKRRIRNELHNMDRLQMTRIEEEMKDIWSHRRFKKSWTWVFPTLVRIKMRIEIKRKSLRTMRSRKSTKKKYEEQNEEFWHATSGKRYLRIVVVDLWDHKEYEDALIVRWSHIVRFCERSIGTSHKTVKRRTTTMTGGEVLRWLTEDQRRRLRSKRNWKEAGLQSYLMQARKKNTYVWTNETVCI